MSNDPPEGTPTPRIPSPSTESEPTAENPGASPSELNQIREILFGTIQRRLDERLRALEDRLDREFAQLRTEIQLRNEAIDAATKDKFEVAHQRLANTEQALRFFTNEQTSALRKIFTDKVEAMRAELQETSARLTKRTTDRSVLSELLQEMAGRLRDDTRD